MCNKKAINIIGNILMLLSLVFILNMIIKYKFELSNFFSISTLIIIIISIIIYSIIVVTYAKLYQTLLKLFSDSEISYHNSVFIYCKSNLYKYLPGNFFHYIGRDEITTDEMVSHNLVISTTIAEILFLSLASLITAVVFAGRYAIKWVIYNKNYIDNYKIIIVIFTFGFLTIILRRSCSNFKGWIENYINQIRRIKFNKILKLLVAYITTFILNGILFIMVLNSIGGKLNNDFILPVIGMYSFSWIIGFITPGAPAGLGIREVIMSSLLFGSIEERLVITTVLLNRIVTILGDVLSFIIVYIFKTAKNKK